MNRFLFSLVFGLLLFTSCSSPSNEKKALRLIEPEVKSHLLKPKSYKLSNIRLDSCFSDDPTHNPEMITFVIKLSSLYNEYKGFKEDAEHALDMKALYSSIGSIYSENDNNKYQKEYEIAKRKAEDRKAQIINLYKLNENNMRASQLNKHEFVGWLALFFYTAETVGGYEISGSKLFYMDKNFEEITYSFDENDFNNMADIEDLNYEFEDDLKTVFGQDVPIMIGRLNIKK